MFLTYVVEKVLVECSVKLEVLDGEVHFFVDRFAKLRYSFVVALVLLDNLADEQTLKPSHCTLFTFVFPFAAKKFLI